MNEEIEKKQKPNLAVEYEIVVRDKYGKIIEQRHEESKSLVKNFALLLNALFNVSTKSVVDLSGASVAGSAKSGIANTPGGWSPIAGGGGTICSIMVGTGTAAVSADDYKLAAKISHGTGTGQLIYYFSAIYDPVIDGTTVKQEIRRAFKNDSGADITVNEIGLIVKTNVDIFLVLIIRDVIAPLTIPNGATYTVKYYIQTS